MIYELWVYHETPNALGIVGWNNDYSAQDDPNKLWRTVRQLWNSESRVLVKAGDVYIGIHHLRNET